MIGRCPFCAADVLVRRDGLLRIHGSPGARCAGSGAPPWTPRQERSCRICRRPADPTISPYAGWCGPEHRDAGRADLRRQAAARSRARRPDPLAAARYS